MKKVILCALVLAVHGVLLNSVLAQETPRYVVTYIKSQTGEEIRSATVVTVVNQSSTVCNVEVAWFTGVGPLLGTSSVPVGSGQAFQFCSRSLPNSITRCDSISRPELNAPELLEVAGHMEVQQGKAIVSSTTRPACSRIAIEARVYYTRGKDDKDISAISNSKVVFIDEGNLGD
jgi:hypothetical protein